MLPSDCPAIWSAIATMPENSGVAALVPDAFVEPAVAGGAGRVAPPLASLVALPTW